MTAIVQVRDINLAAAMASWAEVEFVDAQPVQKFHDHQTGEEFFVFRFKDSKKARELYGLWNDKDLLTKHPDHPLAYLQAAVHNRNRLLDAIKKNPTYHIIKKGGKIYCLPKGATA